MRGLRVSLFLKNLRFTQLRSPSFIPGQISRWLCKILRGKLVLREIGGIDRISTSSGRVDTYQGFDRLSAKHVCTPYTRSPSEWLVLVCIVRVAMLAKPSSVLIAANI